MSTDFESRIYTGENEMWFKKDEAIKSEEFPERALAQITTQTAVLDRPKPAPVQLPITPSWEKIKRESVTSDYKEFANQCSSLLGYKTLEAKVVKPLAEVLAKLEIDVLNDGEVKQYMNTTSSIAQAKSDLEWSARYGEYGYNYHIQMMKPVFKWGSSILDSSKEGQDTPAYRGEVPEFVLNKALQIKKEMPQANFHVWDMQSFQDPFLSVSFGEFPHQESYFIEVWDEPKFEGRIEKVNKD